MRQRLNENSDKKRIKKSPISASQSTIKNKRERQPQERKAFSTHEVAEKLGISYWTLLEWINNKKVAAVKIGRHYRIRTEEVDRMLAEGV